MKADRYEIAVHVPEGFMPKAATLAGLPAQTQREGSLLRVSFMPAATGEVDWSIQFE